MGILYTIYCHSPGGVAAVALGEWGSCSSAQHDTTLQQPWRSLHCVCALVVVCVISVQINSVSQTGCSWWQMVRAN